MTSSIDIMKRNIRERLLAEKTCENKVEKNNMANILFICGSLNQTTQMHAIARKMKEHNCYFTPYYADGVIDLIARMGWLDFTVLGGRHKRETVEYLSRHNLNIDPRGEARRSADRPPGSRVLAA